MGNPLKEIEDLYGVIMREHNGLLYMNTNPEQYKRHMQTIQELENNKATTLTDFQKSKISNNINKVLETRNNDGTDLTSPWQKSNTRMLKAILSYVENTPSKLWDN